MNHTEECDRGKARQDVKEVSIFRAKAYCVQYRRQNIWGETERHDGHTRWLDHENTDPNVNKGNERPEEGMKWSETFQ